MTRKVFSLLTAAGCDCEGDACWGSTHTAWGVEDVGRMKSLLPNRNNIRIFIRRIMDEDQSVAYVSDLMLIVYRFLKELAVRLRHCEGNLSHRQ